MQLLSPKKDIVFHALFREDTKELLAKMLSAILKRKVHVLSIDKDRYLELTTPEDKYGIMDLRATLDNKDVCHIEIQLSKYTDILNRLLYYWADNYKRQLKKKGTYSDLKRAISILITEHSLDELRDIKSTGLKWQIKDSDTGVYVLTDTLEVYIIELDKVRRLYKENPSSEIYQWMMFLDNPNSEEVDAIMKENKDICEATSNLEDICTDEELQRFIQYKEKQEHDWASYREQSLKEGHEEGLKEGLEKGIEKGIEKGQKEIITNMLNSGMSLEQISNITKLSIDKLKQLSAHK